MQAEENARIPRSIGDYAIICRLGGNALADFLLARKLGEAGFEKLVTIQLINRELGQDPQLVEMLREEVNIAAALSHDGISQVFDFGRHEDTYYLALEYAPGKSLWSVQRKVQSTQTHVPAELAALCVSLACEAVQYGHRLALSRGRGIVHGGLSAHAMIVSFSGTLKIIGYGLGRALLYIARSRPDYLKGRLAYLAPEQIRDGTADARADVFALGGTLYELLAGRPAFRKGNDVLTLNAILEEPAEELRTIAPHAPLELVDIVERALIKRRSKRWQTAEEMQGALDDYVHARGTHRMDLARWLTELYAEELREAGGRSILLAGSGVASGLELALAVPMEQTTTWAQVLDQPTGFGGDLFQPLPMGMKNETIQLGVDVFWPEESTAGGTAPEAPLDPRPGPVAPQAPIDEEDEGPTWSMDQGRAAALVPEDATSLTDAGLAGPTSVGSALESSTILGPLEKGPIGPPEKEGPTALGAEPTHLSQDLDAPTHLGDPAEAPPSPAGELAFEDSTHHDSALEAETRAVPEEPRRSPGEGRPELARALRLPLPGQGGLHADTEIQAAERSLLELETDEAGPRAQGRITRREAPNPEELRLEVAFRELGAEPAPEPEPEVPVVRGLELAVGDDFAPQPGVMEAILRTAVANQVGQKREIREVIRPSPSAPTEFRDKNAETMAQVLFDLPVEPRRLSLPLPAEHAPPPESSALDPAEQAPAMLDPGALVELATGTAKPGAPARTWMRTNAIMLAAVGVLFVALLSLLALVLTSTR